MASSGCINLGRTTGHHLTFRFPIHYERVFRIVFIGLFPWLLLLPSSVAAQQIKVNLDPAQTKIEWTLGDVLHTVHGTFKLRSGSVTFDLQSGDASGDIIVDATSGESGNNIRDKKMHKEVLESQRYPEIIFSPKHVTGKVADQGTSNLQVQGVFRIHGADHDLTLSLPVEKSGDEVKASTSFFVPYQDWGMKNPSTFILKVENKVSISISIVGQTTLAGAESKAHRVSLEKAVH
jgi:polyisoprenoid-binding protein YceI